MSVIGFLKKFVNSTIGTSGAKPIDQMLNDKINRIDDRIDDIEEKLDERFDYFYKYDRSEGVFYTITTSIQDCKGIISGDCVVTYKDKQGVVKIFNPIIEYTQNTPSYYQVDIRINSNLIMRLDDDDYEDSILEASFVYKPSLNANLYDRIQKYKVLLDDNNVCNGYEIFTDYEEKDKVKTTEKLIEKMVLNQNGEDEEEQKENYIIFRTLNGLKNIKNIRDIVGRKFNERTEQFEMVGDRENGRTKQ